MVRLFCPGPLADKLISLGIITVAVVFIIGIAYYFIRDDTKYVYKRTIQQIVKESISNGADLRAVRNIYENRMLRKKTLYQLFNSMEEYYKESIPLSKMLEDIRSALYKKKGNDPLLIRKIERIAKEHSERNPFDALEPNQKNHFENIRIKSGFSYRLIRNDIDKLAVEMETKNALVGKYLNLSNTSFWISLLALIFSLSIGLYQIYQNRATRLRTLFSALFSKHGVVEKKENDNPGAK